MLRNGLRSRNNLEMIQICRRGKNETDDDITGETPYHQTIMKNEYCLN